MIGQAWIGACLLMCAGIIFTSCRQELRRWRAGEIGALRLGVKGLAITLAALGGWAVFAKLVPNNAPAAIVIWVLGGMVLGGAWARLDERIEQWEAP